MLIHAPIPILFMVQMISVCGVFDIQNSRMTLEKKSTTLKLVIGVMIKVRYEGEYQVVDAFESPLCGTYGMRGTVTFLKNWSFLHN